MLTEVGKKSIVDMYDQEKHFVSYFDQKSIEVVNNLKFDIYSQGKKNKSELYFQFLEYVTQQNSFIHLREDCIFTLG